MNETKLDRAHSDNNRTATRLLGLQPSSLKLASAGIQMPNGSIDLASGTPYFAVPDLLKDAAIAAITADQNQYSHPWGDSVLRQKIARHYSLDGGFTVDPDSQVTVTNGSSSALASVLMASLDPGDEVILFEPCYESYVSAVKMAGGVPRVIPLNKDDWSLRLDLLEDVFNDKTKVVILNTPHNPTGQIFGADQIAYLADLCEEHNTLLVSDEIYANLVFEGNTHKSPYHSASVDRDRVVVVNGLSKAHNVSGWRIGYVIASEAFTSALRIVHSTFGLAAPTPLQIASRQAFEIETVDDASIPGTNAYYQRNLHLLHTALTEAGLIASRPKGGSFIFADASSLPRDEGQSPRDYLLENLGILTMTGTPFFPESGALVGKNYVRLCFGRPLEQIEEVCDRLKSLNQGD